MLVGRQQKAASQHIADGGFLSYHEIGAQPSVSQAHLLYLRHQGLEKRVGGWCCSAGGGDVFGGG